MIAWKGALELKVQMLSYFLGYLIVEVFLGRPLSFGAIFEDGCCFYLVWLAFAFVFS